MCGDTSTCCKRDLTRERALEGGGGRGGAALAFVKDEVTPQAAVWRSGQRGQCGDQGELLSPRPSQGSWVLTLKHMLFTLRPAMVF